MKIALFGTNFSENFNKYIQHLINKLEAENVKYIKNNFSIIILKIRLELKKIFSNFKIMMI